MNLIRLNIPDMLVETNVKHFSIIHCAKSCMGYKLPLRRVSYCFIARNVSDMTCFSETRFLHYFCSCGLSWFIKQTDFMVHDFGKWWELALFK